MKLGFQERQSPYSSGSQSARFWTEKWVENSLYCPNCGNVKLDKFANNRPVADFLCTSCREEFELKSQKSKFGAKVVDGAYKTMRERIVADNNPNFLFMNYSLRSMGVVDLFIVPKHFFVPKILEQRKPLAETARRAGWVGCNIMLNEIPESGKIFYVRNGLLTDKKAVLSQWQETLFLRNQNIEAKGWLLEVMKCVEAIGKSEFDLDTVYLFENHLSKIFPNNKNVRR
jgi:type II restriction enzyme